MTGDQSEPGLQIFAAGWTGSDRGFRLRDPIDTLFADSADDAGRVLLEASARAMSGAVVAGWLAYEAAPAFDPAFHVHPSPGPYAWFAVYDADAPEQLDAAKPPGRFRVAAPRFSLTAHAYRAAFTRIQEAIYEGDVYQINFTAPLSFDVDGSPLDLWRALMARQPVPFGAYIDSGDLQILSCSPELFFRRKDDAVITRPMKGTVRRGSNEAEDDALEAWLVSDPKSRAENLMIVDLLRNDLSRCCMPGTVRVPELFAAERYSTVIQMTSEVHGRLCERTSTADIFAALFPCGSVTGAPKIEAMRLIRDLEAHARGVYCGAVGFMHGPDAVFNVGIRTAIIRGRRGVLGIGSGLVADSEAEAEYDECLLKARFLTDLADRSAPAVVAHRRKDSPALIETMRAESGVIALLELHAERLRNSALELGYCFDEAAWRRAVEAVIPPHEPQKVRSLLRSDGELDVTAESLSLQNDDWRVMLSDHRINEDDVYRRHKTTNRHLYDTEWRRATESGYDEVLFLNRRGECAEGSRTNLILRRGDEWLTPPVGSGALPGVFRRHMVQSRGVLEAHLRPEDFETADEVYLCNAVRGLIRAQIVLAPEVYREDVTEDDLQQPN